MNTAQQVRVWIGVGVGILLAISVIGLAASLTSVSNFSGTGNTALFTLNATGFEAWFALALVCLVTEGILAGFSIYRMYNPIRKLPQQQTASMSAHGQPAPSGPYQPAPGVPSQAASTEGLKPPADVTGPRSN
jgi:hypothetical protein